MTIMSKDKDDAHSDAESLNSDIFGNCLPSDSEDNASNTTIIENEDRLLASGSETADDEDYNTFMQNLSEDEDDANSSSVSKNNLTTDELIDQIISVIKDKDKDVLNSTKNLPRAKFDELDATEFQSSKNDDFDNFLSKTAMKDKTSTPLIRQNKEENERNNQNLTFGELSQITSDNTLLADDDYDSENLELVDYESDKIDNNNFTDDNILMKADQEFLDKLPVIEPRMFNSESFNDAMKKVAAKWNVTELHRPGTNLTCCTSLRKKYKNSIPNDIYTLEGNDHIGVVCRKPGPEKLYQLALKRKQAKDESAGVPSNKRLSVEFKVEENKHLKKLNDLTEKRIRELVFNRNQSLIHNGKEFGAKKHMAINRNIDLLNDIHNNYLYMPEKKDQKQNQQKHLLEIYLHELNEQYETICDQIEQEFTKNIQEVQNRMFQLENEIHQLHNEFRKTGFYPFEIGETYDVFELRKNPSNKHLSSGEWDFVTVYIPIHMAKLMMAEEEIYDKIYPNYQTTNYISQFH